jgi:lysophospholipase L1-like esterase
MSQILFLSHSGELGLSDLIRSIAFAALVALLGCVEARAEDCNRLAVQVTTDPVPYQYPHGLEKAYRLLENVPASADTILIGDSLVANWPKDLAAQQFGKSGVWNFAVGGSVTQNTLWQLGKLDASHLKPARVIVLVGTNNLTHDYMPACSIAAGIEKVVLSVHEKWPDAKVHVMGIPPRGIDFRFRDDVRLAVNAEIKAWSHNVANVHYFEVGDSEMTCGEYDKALAISNASTEAHPKSRCENYADDFGHFHRSGYEVIFSALRKSAG